MADKALINKLTGSFSGVGLYASDRPWVDIMHPSFGAVGDGDTDDTDALEEWYDRIPHGGTGYLPPELGFRFTRTQRWNKRVNIMGGGLSSALIPDVGPDADAIIVNDTEEAILYRIRHEHFALFSATPGCCRNGIIYNRTFNSHIDVHVKVPATQWGTIWRGGECSRVFLVTSNNGGAMPWPAAMPVGGYFLVEFDSLGYGVNANVFDVLLEGGYGNGMIITDQFGNGNNHVKGVIQGVQGAVAFSATRCVGLSAHHLHIEANAGTTTFDRCELLEAGPSFMHFELDTPLKLAGCVGAVVDGVLTDSLEVDDDCRSVRLRALTYNISGGNGRVIDPGERATWEGPIRDAAGGLFKSVTGPGVTDAMNLFTNGKLERWPLTTSRPTDWIDIGTPATWERTGVGQTDTRRHYGRYAAKVTLNGVANFGAGFVADYETISGQWITHYAWIYIPTGEPDVRSKVYFDDGANVQQGDPITARDQWIRLATRYYAGAEFSGALLLFGGAAAGTFYVADCGYTVGNTAPIRELPVRPHPGRGALINGLTEFSASAMPTAGRFAAGDSVRNELPVIAEGPLGNYVVRGWTRMTTGDGHTLYNDWTEDRHNDGRVRGLSAGIRTDGSLADATTWMLNLDGDGRVPASRLVNRAAGGHAWLAPYVGRGTDPAGCWFFDETANAYRFGWNDALGAFDIPTGALALAGAKVLTGQLAAVADATGAGDVVAQLNALLATMRAKKLLAP